jgi:hypothetical protein
MYEVAQKLPRRSAVSRLAIDLENNSNIVLPKNPNFYQNLKSLRLHSSTFAQWDQLFLVPFWPG